MTFADAALNTRRHPWHWICLSLETKRRTAAEAAAAVDGEINPKGPFPLLPTCHSLPTKFSPI